MECSLLSTWVSMFLIPNPRIITTSYSESHWKQYAMGTSCKGSEDGRNGIIFMQLLGHVLLFIYSHTYIHIDTCL